MIDGYTKGVLTVIAGALLVLIAQNVVLPARAQYGGEPQKVQICDGNHCAGLSPVTSVVYGQTYTYWAIDAVDPGKR